MRIGVDARELGGGVRTGIGRYLEAFIAHVATLRPDAGLILYADAATHRAPYPEVLEEQRLPSPLTLWFDQVSLPRALARDRADVFFSPYYKAPVHAPCPTVVTVHDVLFLRIGGSRFKNFLFRPWARLIASRSAAVLTDSEHSRRDLESLLGLRDIPIEVVPLGVSCRFSPDAAVRVPELRSRWGLPAEYLLTLTNFLPHKNDTFSVRVFARVASDYPELGLVIAGRPAGDSQAVKTMADRLGLSQRVVLCGAIDEADLPALYAGARVFVFPSLYEGFGLPVLEAMASGVPVICSARSSLPEVAGEAAMLLDPEDEVSWEKGLRHLLDDATYHRRMGAAGRERARRFTWDACVARILAVLDRAATS